MGDFAADGTVVHSTDLNKILKVIGVAAVAGSPPTAGASSGYTIQAGSFVGTTNGSAQLSITYPTAFTTGLVVATVCWGDQVSSGFGLEVSNNTSKTTLVVRVVNSSGTGQNSFGPVRVNWMALGWT
jgi:hypothetical protein